MAIWKEECLDVYWDSNQNLEMDLEQREKEMKDLIVLILEIAFMPIYWLIIRPIDVWIVTPFMDWLRS